MPLDVAFPPASVSTSAPGSPAPRILAAAGLTGIATSVALLAALHVVSPELDPLRRLISEYVRGEHGWMFDVAVLALAAGSLALLAALVTGGIVRASSASAVALALWSGCLVAVVVFPVGDIWKRPVVATAHIHSVAAILAFVCLPVAAFLIGRAWRGHPEWGGRAAWTSRLGVCCLPWLVSVLVGLDLTRPPDAATQLVPAGLAERALAVHAVAALALLGCWAASTGAASRGQRARRMRGPRAPARAR